MSITISSEGAHEAFMAMTTTMAMKATNVDNEAPWAGARNFLIPSRNGNHDRKNWQRRTTSVGRRGLMLERTTYLHRLTRL